MSKLMSTRRYRCRWYDRCRRIGSPCGRRCQQTHGIWEIWCKNGVVGIPWRCQMTGKVLSLALRNFQSRCKLLLELSSPILKPCLDLKYSKKFRFFIYKYYGLLVRGHDFCRLYHRQLKTYRRE